MPPRGIRIRTAAKRRSETAYKTGGPLWIPSETRAQINELIESARKWLTRLGMTSLLLLVVLGIIFGIVLLRKL